MTVTAPLLTNSSLVQALLAGDPDAIAASLADARLLIPACAAAEDQLMLAYGRCGDGRRLVWAFTDLEALQAWDRRPADAYSVIGAAGLTSLLPGGIGAIAINAAGPGGQVIDASVLSPGSVVTVSRPAAVHDDADAHVDSQARSPLRRRAREAHARGRAAAVAGRREEACAHFRRALEVCTTLGDRLHGAATALELAGCQAEVESPRIAVATASEAGEVLALFGELDLATGALLEAAELAADARLDREARLLATRLLELLAGPGTAARLAALWIRPSEGHDHEAQRS
jgi:tetratricopeptide (TPR) repeat protein